MLGIRKIQNLSIDLWFGNFESFVCDVLVTPKFFDSLSIDEHLRNFQEHRHVAVAFEAFENRKVEELFRCILVNGAFEENKRLTLIFQDLPSYQCCQDLLFSTFPEFLS